MHKKTPVMCIHNCLSHQLSNNPDGKIIYLYTLRRRCTQHSVQIWKRRHPLYNRKLQINQQNDCWQANNSYQKLTPPHEKHVNCNLQVFHLFVNAKDCVLALDPSIFQHAYATGSRGSGAYPAISSTIVTYSH